MPYSTFALVVAMSAVVSLGQPEAAPMAAVEPVIEPVGRGTVRFHAGPEAAAAAERTPSLMGELRVRGKVPENFPVAVAFELAEGRRVARIQIEPGTSVYGGGGATGGLLRNGQVIECWNADGAGAEGGAWSQSHPWVLAVRPDGTAFGVLAETSHRCTIELTDGIAFKTSGPALPIVVIERESPIDVLMALAGLTGYMPLPPRWALGYHHGGAFENAGAVRAAAAGLREHDIPCDALWLGVETTDEGRSFTLSEGFADPEGLIADLAAMGMRTVWRVEPAVAADPMYDVYDAGMQGDAWVKRADGSVFVGTSAVGPAVFPDFTAPGVQTWWAELTSDLVRAGAGGVWNAANEPRVINAPGGTIPEDAQHLGDEDFGEGTHRRFHNVYGMLMAGAARNAWRDAGSAGRPFVLSEANHLGGQRYAAATVPGTADATPERLVSAVLNLGLSGQPFAGALVAGASPERRIGVAAMLPFVRGHSSADLWEAGPEAVAAYTAALERRYRLLPHLYTLFREASISGVPVARPVFFADPKDPSLRAEGGAFLLGENLLVVPPAGAGEDRAPALPKGTWRPFHFGDQTPDLPELRLRAGGIVPVGPAMEHTGEFPPSPLTLIVSLDENGSAKGTLYEDDGEGYDYMSGRYLISIYRADRMQDGAIVVQLASEAGLMPRPARPLSVRVLLDGGREVVGIGTDGEPVRIQAPQ